VRRLNFPPEFSARILDIRHNFHETLEFYVFADILGGRQHFMILLDFVAANICVFYLCICVCAIFLAQLF
jgi:hypothetical protein